MIKPVVRSVVRNAVIGIGRSAGQSWSSYWKELNLIVTIIEDGVRLDWTDNFTSEDGFEIWISINGADYVLLAVTDKNVNSYDDLVSDGILAYKIRAFKGTLKSEFSETVEISLVSTLLTGINHYWKLEETSGVFKDEVGANDGTGTGSLTWGVDGKINKAADFDSALSNSGKISFGAIGESVSTLSFWANRNTTTGNILVCKINTNGIGVGGWWITSANPALIGYVNGTGTLTGIQWSAIWADDDNWHHIALATRVVGNSTTGKVRLYFDGVDKGETTGEVSGLDILEIGYAGTAGGAGHYDGKADEVGIWDRVLTSDEITELYNSGNGISYPF